MAMPITGFSTPTLTPLSSLSPKEAQPAGGFAGMVNQLLDNNRVANASAEKAITDLATGEAQDLHTVALAVAQADLSFRMVLELRNRLTDAVQEVLRMQV